MNRVHMWIGGVFVALIAAVGVRSLGSPEGRTGAPEFADAIVAGGFFAHNPDAEACRDRVAEDPNQLWACESGRLFHADAEGLAEGFALTFISLEVGPFLKHQGCTIDDATDSHEVYGIEVDGRRYTILEDPESEDSWTEASDNTLALLNDLLERAGSAERAYGVYGGEDLHIVFLTPELFERIRSEPGISAREKPWQRADGAA